MINMFRRLTAKEWGMIALSTVFICLAVWMDLKTPEYLSDITTLLAKEGTKVSDIMDPGSKMLLFSFGSFLMAVFVGFLASRVAASFTTRLRGEIFHQVMDYSDAEIKKFSVPSLLTRTTNDLTQLQIMIVMGMQVVTRGPIMAIWALTKIWGKSSAWTTSVGIAVLMVLILLSVLVLIAFPRQQKVQGLTDALNATTRESLTGVRVVRAYNAEAYQNEKFQAENKGLTRLNLFVYRLMSLMNPVMTVVSSGLTLAIYWIGAHLINDIAMPKDPTKIFTSPALADRTKVFSDMITFSSYAMQVVVGFMMMVAILIILPRALVSAKRINQVLALEPSVAFPSESKETTGQEGTVEFQDVSFRYGRTSRAVIEHVTFSAQKGQTVAFIGSTGSGKSTCMNIIGCLDVPTEGTYLLDGKDVGKMSRRELAHIRNEKLGFIFQQYNLLPKLTLLENVEVPLVYAGIPAAQRHATAKAALERVGLGNKLKNLPNQLSGGQQQRVSIARALARGPAVILADEPTGALDSHTSREVLGMLQDLHKQGNTVVLITHDNSIAVQAERIIRLEDGRVVYDGDAHAPEAVVQPNFMMAEPKAGEEGTQA